MAHPASRSASRAPSRSRPSSRYEPVRPSRLRDVGPLSGPCVQRRGPRFNVDLQSVSRRSSPVVRRTVSMPVSSRCGVPSASWQAGRSRRRGAAGHDVAAVGHGQQRDDPGPIRIWARAPRAPGTNRPVVAEIRLEPLKQPALTRGRDRRGGQSIGARGQDLRNRVASGVGSAGGQRIDGPEVCRWVHGVHGASLRSWSGRNAMRVLNPSKAPCEHHLQPVRERVVPPAHPVPGAGPTRQRPVVRRHGDVPM
jgi:hypothetical protein